ncbi:hypothetical protein [uncultured Agrococcus sp.]|uniref:hypothetical protein n=1 Tax=uncultured Agrococcus sp. TaxID=382258 RepID=UPI0025E3B4E8|nr:hypothetical protein [uncultured Agrococcus sp.]
MTRRILILGLTGSLGTQALDVVETAAEAVASHSGFDLSLAGAAAADHWAREKAAAIIRART